MTIKELDKSHKIGISIGRIKHWCGGTDYFIEELCIRPDMQRFIANIMAFFHGTRT